MKLGDEALKELRAQASLEDFEKLVENHEDNLALLDREVEMFGKVIERDELEAELDELMGVSSEKPDPILEIPNAPVGVIDQPIPDAPTGKIEPQ